MKINIDLNDDYKETSVTIKCNKIDEEVLKLEKTLKSYLNKDKSLIFYKDNKEYYFNINNILFFETDNNIIYAHTINDAFIVKKKLYELENILPDNYLRVSKSTIVNINQILSISHNFASSSLIEFNKTHKQVYVSRSYYKYLSMLLKERRTYEN
jgi:Response regulator of the LytR/AlgR family